MLRFGAIVRLLMLAACLVPFTSQRQAVGALSPYVPLTPLAPVAPANEAPVSEEDDERENDARGHSAAPAKHRTAREASGLLPPGFATHPTRFIRVRGTPPVAADPFCNGLGSPYRC